jgi:hypothetical protein
MLTISHQIENFDTIEKLVQHCQQLEQAEQLRNQMEAPTND